MEDLSKEKLSPAEGRVLLLANRVNQAFLNSDNGSGPPDSMDKPGGRSLACAFTSDLVRRAAQLQGILARNFQLKWVHRYIETGDNFVPEDKERVWELPGIKRGFQHGISILDFPESNEHFLVDISFTQFLKDHNLLDQQDNPPRSLSDEERPLVNQLLTFGYIPLNDKTLRLFLGVTCYDLDEEYMKKISQFRVKDLDNILPLPPANPDRNVRLDRYL